MASFATYALDHRGHGQSSGPRALIDRMGHAVTDVDSLVTLAAARDASRPIPARTVAEVATAIERFSTELPTLRLPLLVMAGTVDRIVPAGSDEVVGGHRGG